LVLVNSNQNKNKTHCIHGHEFAGDNLITLKNGYRVCKTCQHEAITRYHRSPIAKIKSFEYRKLHRLDRLEAGRKRRKAAREFVYDIKNKSCTDCGETYPPYVMDLDHCRGEKILEVSSMIDYGWNRKTLLDEIDKCDVVCSNCHRIRTWNRNHGK
jgi:hypothetical protein